MRVFFSQPLAFNMPLPAALSQFCIYVPTEPESKNWPLRRGDPLHKEQMLKNICTLEVKFFMPYSRHRMATMQILAVALFCIPYQGLSLCPACSRSAGNRVRQRRKRAASPCMETVRLGSIGEAFCVRCSGTPVLWISEHSTLESNFNFPPHQNISRQSRNYPGEWISQCPRAPNIGPKDRHGNRCSSDIRVYLPQVRQEFCRSQQLSDAREVG